jgi:hypothetical protein
MPPLGGFLDAAEEHAAGFLWGGIAAPGPGDWMFPGQLTLVEARTMSWNAASSAALSLANV